MTSAWEELMAHFSLIRHGPHRKRKNTGEHTHTEQGDFVNFLTEIEKGDIQTDLQGEASKIRWGGYADRWTDRWQDDLITSFYFFKIRKVG
jgi:hypothetical protein